MKKAPGSCLRVLLLLLFCFAHTLNHAIKATRKRIDFFICHFIQSLKAAPGGHALVVGRGFRRLYQPPGRVVALRLMGAMVAIFKAATVAILPVEGVIPRGGRCRYACQKGGQGFRRNVLAGDYAAAERLLAEARKSGVAEAADALRQLAERPATNNETIN